MSIDLIVTPVTGQQTGWTLEEFSEDLEFRVGDDNETRDFRMVNRIVITSEIYQATSIDTNGLLDTSINGPGVTMYAAGTIVTAAWAAQGHPVTDPGTPAVDEHGHAITEAAGHDTDAGAAHDDGDDGFRG